MKMNIVYCCNIQLLYQF